MSPFTTATTTTSSPLSTVLLTTTSLIEQFLSSLAPNSAHAHTPLPPSSSNTTHPSPLLLLEAASKSLKSQTTKLSLLTVTAPFTASAVVNCLIPLNESVLPSLVTAALLTTPDAFSGSFANEAKGLVRAVLREIMGLLRLVEGRRRDGEDAKQEMSKGRKKEFTEATGRVWEACNAITVVAEEGFVGFTVRKARQWLELMKDAVRELEEWDPEEDVGDDGFGDVLDDDGSVDGDTDEKGEADRATISAGVKDQVLTVLKRVPQSIHVVVKQRLEKMTRPPADQTLSLSLRSRLDKVLIQTRNISELIDEAAEAMYMGDPELCLKKAGEARAVTIEAVEGLLRPLDEGDGDGGGKSEEGKESKEDLYVKRALEWIRQVDMGRSKEKIPA